MSATAIGNVVGKRVNGPLELLRPGDGARLVIQAPQDDPLLARIAVLPHALPDVAIPEVIYDCVGDHASVPDNDPLVVIYQAIFQKSRIAVTGSA